MSIMIIEWLAAGAEVAIFIALLLIFRIHSVPTSPKCRCPTCKPMRERFKQWERERTQTGERR